MGYSYIGPNSLYRLTIPEILKLQRGYIALNQTSEGKTGPRKSDWKKMAKFMRKLN